MTTHNSIFTLAMHFRGHCEGGVRSGAGFRLAEKHLLQPAQRNPSTSHAGVACTTIPGESLGCSAAGRASPMPLSDRAPRGAAILRPSLGQAGPASGQLLPDRHSKNTRCRQLIKQLYINT